MSRADCELDISIRITFSRSLRLYLEGVFHRYVGFRRSGLQQESSDSIRSATVRVEMKRACLADQDM